MPLYFVQNDITRLNVDAIVNAANASLLGGGGVDGAIHAAAGPELLVECRTLHGCDPGDAKITGGYRLPARYVIHTVGPIWHGGFMGERETLTSCYRRCLELAEEYECQTLAFPLISAGAYGYPKAEALEVAVETIRAFLEDHELTVYLVIFDRRSFRPDEELLEDVREYMDRRTEEASEAGQKQKNLFLRKNKASSMPAAGARPQADMDAYSMAESAAMPQAAPAMSLEDRLSHLDESFSQALLRMIDEKGITDAACYKKANIDRKLFSKIRKDPGYRPSKPTAIAFAIALELSPEETGAFLRKAGYALSPSSKFDLIVEYFIQKGNYDIFEINEALFAFDQSLLGVS